jgi:hypothetical protein
MERQYVDFPIALLLKEKGFNEDCSSVYNHRAELLENYALINQHPTEYLPEKESEFLLIPRNSNDGSLYIDKIDFNSWEDYYSAPEIWQVVEYLRVEKGIWVSVAPRFHGDGSLWYVYEALILERNNIDTLNDNLFQGIFSMFKTPQEAYNAALKYILEEFI